MIKKSKYAKKFVSDMLTEEKFGELHEYAIYLLDHKNKISNLISKDLFKYLEMKPLEFVTLMRKQFKGEVNSNFDKQLYQDIFVCYQNKFEAIKNRLTFNLFDFNGIHYYKKTTKKHNKGDFKSFNINKRSTPLTITLTYLARYGNKNIIEYINNQLIELKDENKIQFYKNILRCVDKFGFERLYNIALLKRQNTINKYNKPIEFKSLTFRGRSRKTKILDYNKNYNSKINSFITLSWNDIRKSMDIPVKFAKNYHGNIKDYLKKTNDYEYVLQIDERRKQVKITLVKSDNRYIPEVNDNDELIGIDVNIKHNLFSLSNGISYDYNRKLVNDYAKLCSKIDTNKKQQDKDYKIGKRLQYKVDAITNKIKKYNQQLIANICKELKNKNIKHIVMENLDNGFGRSYIKDKSNEDVNFNRIVKVLNISSLKDEFIHIGRKYNIGVSLVQSFYTSKMCSICGCIDDENRTSQEEFNCIECHHKFNADTNAAFNIRNRVSITVLRNKLLKQIDNGTYEPIKLKKEKVKEVLLSYRTHLNKDRESENYIFS